MCIAVSFSRYDSRAIRQIKRSIMLARYQWFGTDLLMLEPLELHPPLMPADSTHPGRGAAHALVMSGGYHGGCNR